MEIFAHIPCVQINLVEQLKELKPLYLLVRSWKISVANSPAGVNRHNWTEVNGILSLFPGFEVELIVFEGFRLNNVLMSYSNR